LLLVAPLATQIPKRALRSFSANHPKISLLLPKTRQISLAPRNSKFKSWKGSFTKKRQLQIPVKLHTRQAPQTINLRSPKTQSKRLSQVANPKLNLSALPISTKNLRCSGITGPCSRSALFKKYFSHFTPQETAKPDTSGKRVLPITEALQGNSSETSTGPKIEGLIGDLPQMAQNLPGKGQTQLNQQQINDLLDMMINVVEYDINLHSGDEYTIGVDMTGKKLDRDTIKNMVNGQNGIKESKKNNRNCETFVKDDQGEGFKCLSCKPGFKLVDGLCEVNLGELQEEDNDSEKIEPSQVGDVDSEPTQQENDDDD
jgi:hypothetical protein